LKKPILGFWRERLRMTNKPKMIVILGPTSSGKTSLSLKLAKRFNGEIISADSRQIYRGMDIATGKVKADNDYCLSVAEGGVENSQNKKNNFSTRSKNNFFYGVINGIPHYMIDIINPDEEFSVAEYKKTTIEIANDIIRRGKTPFLVGGTGLYIKAVVDNFDIPRVLPNKELREEFERALVESRITNQESRILEKFYKELLKLDPGAENIVDKNNPRRIIRALEICLVTGRAFSELYNKGEQIFNSLQIGIDVSRDILYKRIDKRVDEMMKDGIIEETKSLIKKGYSASLPSMSGIGYKEIGEYLSEKLKVKNEKLEKDIIEKKIQEIKWRTHDYARRQMTWFKKDGRVRWVNGGKEAEKLVKKWLT